MDACAVVLHGAKIDPTIDLIPDNFPVLLWTELFSNLNFRAIAFCSIFLVVQPLSSDIPSLLKTLNQFESGLIVMDLSNETELNGLFSRNLVLIGFGNSASEYVCYNKSLNREFSIEFETSTKVQKMSRESIC